MNKPELTKEIAYKALQNFFDQKPFVLFATGTSCAVDTDFGMYALQKKLKFEIPKKSLNLEQRSEWDDVLKTLGKNGDFESAMNSIKDSNLLKYVISETALFVSGVEKKHSFNLLQGNEIWPAIEIFKRLVKRLPEADKVLHVATPNYDLLAEYAFTQADILYTTGFWGGVVRQLDWKKAERQMTYAEKVSQGRAKPQWVTRVKNHICLYKVHGSLNTFKFDKKIVETDAWEEVPNGVERFIITPGTAKHEKLHEYRDTLLSAFDKAICSHHAFLFLGFGFNDTQLIKNKIEIKLKNEDSFGLIITRESNDNIEALLSHAKNVWVVCKNENNESTRIFNCQYKGWLKLEDKELWRFDHFVTEIMGD